jgi:hypothetical protein
MLLVGVGENLSIGVLVRAQRGGKIPPLWSFERELGDVALGGSVSYSLYL